MEETENPTNEKKCYGTIENFYEEKAELERKLNELLDAFDEKYPYDVISYVTSHKKDENGCIYHEIFRENKKPLILNAIPYANYFITGGQSIV